MNTFELEIWESNGNRCTFYTVKWDNIDISETDKFFERYENDTNFERYIQELAVFLVRKIGNDKGALEEFFRFENSAQALPPSGTHKIDELLINYRNFPLRLYCLRISDSLVVLFNGNEKTSGNAQGGKTSMTFLEANQFSKRILEALSDKEIYITPNKREFRYFNHSKEIFL